MARSYRLQYLIESLGFLIAAVLLIRFALDFGREMSLLLTAPFWALVIAALAVGIANLIRGRIDAGESPRSRSGRVVTLIAIPLSFFAATLDCMGLSVEGCSPFCTFVKLVWIPLVAFACAAYIATGREWLITLLTLMAFVPLAPHCVCYNPGNGWWIDHLGKSPVCYVWGFVVSLLSVGALRSRALFWPAVGICYAIIVGATGFFVAHHYMHFPW